MTDQHLPAGDQDLRERAIAQLKKKSDFSAHLLAYLLVNTFLIAIHWSTLPVAGAGKVAADRAR
jgi:hypothetical protein